MFFDEVQIEVEGGRGGNGAVSFHREKHVDEGGPDGGDGGKGGAVFVEADENFNTLQHFTGLKHFKAEDGEKGFKKRMAGKAGKDLILKVPVGTMIYEGKEFLVDLKAHGQKFLAALGGRGGYGNAHFTSSIRQTPDFAELGDSEVLHKLRLELCLVADVGLLGFPSSGKSTFISHVSSARPKIGAYPFTTLVPNLGVVYLSKWGGNKAQSFVIADMPGIIEGASKGKGLGDAFLKHISRSALLLFLLDPFSYLDLSLSSQYHILLEELEKYDASLLQKDFFVLMNKIDAIPEEDRKVLKAEFLKDFPKLKKKFRMVSGVSGEGMKILLFDLWELVKKYEQKAAEPGKMKEILEYKPLVDENAFTIEEPKKVYAPQFQETVLGQIIKSELKPKRKLFTIRGKRIEQIVRMTNPEQEGAIRRVYDVFKKMGIQTALVKAQAEVGDYLKIGPHIFEIHEL